ncbi:MAG: hypothetical protein RQ897_15775 [Thermoflexus sp.]|jgi:hypothetical protein|nr:hypothetical protein [Thermoflexus sp.]MDT7949797.1 hypothetical protein [Thermoflexus sp.]
MMRYKTRTWVLGGQPADRFLSDWLASYGTPPRYPEDTGPAEERELILEPVIFINVWNCQIGLAAEFILPDGRAIVVAWPRRLPERVARAAERDLQEQGGAINMSGHYRILSEEVHRFVASKRFQDWLRQEARQLGLEVVG